MHYKRKHRGVPLWLIIVLIVVLVLAALGVGGFLWVRENGLPALPVGGAAAASSVAETDTSPKALTHGILLDVTPAACTMDDAALTAHFAEVADYAAQHGAGTLFLQAMSTVGGDTAVFFHGSEFAQPAAVTANDSFFHKYDAAKALTKAAKAQGMTAALVFDAADVCGDAAAAGRHAVATAMKKTGLPAYVSDNGTLYPYDEALAAAGTPAQSGALTCATLSDTGALFAASQQAGFAGAVFPYADCTASPDAYSAAASVLNAAYAVGQLPVASYEAPADVGVTYPEDGAKLTTSALYVMGTSDPTQPLMLTMPDGTQSEVTRPATDGLFGVLVNLSTGENTLTFTQGDKSTAVNVTYTPPAGGSSYGTLPADGTKEVAPGTKVQFPNWIAGLLSNPDADNSITNTVRSGAVATVENCVRTVRNGKRTWAYQLASGDYVLAYNTTAYSGGATEFTGASAEVATINGITVGETLTFAGSGTPLAYTRIEDNNLILTFYGDVTAADTFAVQGSSMVTGAAVQKLSGGVEITLTLTQPLYGYSIEYSDNTTLLQLQRTPVRSVTFGKPLEGVTVLLDAGHGADDSGAMGVGGVQAPLEKDVNLSVTLAAKCRLEQLGATVYTIRTDDTFLTLEERNKMIADMRPDFFLAIHHNSVQLTVDANNTTGVECYYFSEESKALAESVVNNVGAATGRTIRGFDWGYYYVTRTTICPAVLAELGFMVNPAEYEQLIQPDTVLAEGDAIAEAVLANVPAA